MKSFTYLILLAVLLTVSACGGTARRETYTSYSSYYENFLEEKKSLTPEEINRQGHRTLLVHPILSEEPAFDASEDYYRFVIEQVKSYGIYDKVLTAEEVVPGFDSKTREEYEKYIDTYRFSYISDRQFTRVLQEKSGVDSILFLQINAYPCRGCLNADYIQMNLSVVNTYTGIPVWLAYDEDFSEQDLSDLREVSDTVRARLMYSFYLSFRELPHLRYREAMRERVAGN